ncbi:hypothetical protein [Immundisolibacter sp.]
MNKLTKIQEKKWREDEWENSYAAQLDILQMLKKQNAYKRDLCIKIDKDIQKLKEERKAKK